MEANYARAWCEIKWIIKQVDNAISGLGLDAKFKISKLSHRMGTAMYEGNVWGIKIRRNKKLIV